MNPRTAGKPVGIILVADEPRFAADWDCVCFVRAKIVDGSGVRVPGADDAVEFTLSGPGTIATVENGDRKDDESFQSTRHRAYDGWCVAIVKAVGSEGGKIIVTARAAGLAPASVTLWAAPSK